MALVLLCMMMLHLTSGIRYDCSAWLADAKIIEQICLPKSGISFTSKYAVTTEHSGPCSVVQKLKHWKQTFINLAAFPAPTHKKEAARGIWEFFFPVSVEHARTVYQAIWEPTHHCPFATRIGAMGDGGKWACDIESLPKKCLVYSIGSNRDTSYEVAISSTLGCEIHTFDHTIAGWVPPAIPKFTFHPYGFGTGGGQMKTLETIFQELGHKNRVIDIFKIDCEGCEWSQFKTLTDQCSATTKSPLDNINQIQMEVHDMPPFDLVHALSECGFALFYKEFNVHSAGGDCMEISFVRVNYANPMTDLDLQPYLCA